MRRSARWALGILGALVLTNMLRGAAGMVAAAIPALISLAFLYVGVSTIRGKAPDTLGNGVGSIGIGVLGIVAVVLSLVEGMSVISTVIQSLALIVAGWLALAARGDYQRWRPVKINDGRPKTIEVASNKCEHNARPAALPIRVHHRNNRHV